MNYRHIYHAGNFADVLKHAVLTLVVGHMRRKEAPFRVVDTHAGTGLYDLTSGEAERTGEWRDGIGRLLSAAPPVEIAAMLAPYLDMVRAENGGGERILRYPGSPLVARRLMRPVDRLVANEAHPEEAAPLAALFAKDRQVKVLSLDGWTALKAVLPPRERRGVVLIDPPFEEPGEFERLCDGLATAHRRFATGTVILWYPIKDVRAVAAFSRDVAALGIPKLLSVELFTGTPRPDGPLVATGLVILNPPFMLDAKLATLLPYLAALFARDEGAEGRVAWLAGERMTSA